MSHKKVLHFSKFRHWWFKDRASVQLHPAVKLWHVYMERKVEWWVKYKRRVESGFANKSTSDRHQGKRNQKQHSEIITNASPPSDMMNSSLIRQTTYITTITQLVSFGSFSFDCLSICKITSMCTLYQEQLQLIIVDNEMGDHQVQQQFNEDLGKGKDY